MPSREAAAIESHDAQVARLLRTEICRQRVDRVVIELSDGQFRPWSHASEPHTAIPDRSISCSAHEPMVASLNRDASAGMRVHPAMLSFVILFSCFSVLCTTWNPATP